MTTNEAFNIIEEAIQKARAERLVSLPAQKMTIIEAANIVRETCGDNSTVRMEVWAAHTPPVMFEVWDGKRIHAGTTLEEAMRKCLDHHNGKVPPPAPMATIDQANAMLLEACAPAF